MITGDGPYEVGLKYNYTEDETITAQYIEDSGGGMLYLYEDDPDDGGFDHKLKKAINTDLVVSITPSK